MLQAPPASAVAVASTVLPLLIVTVAFGSPLPLRLSSLVMRSLAELALSRAGEGLAAVGQAALRLRDAPGAAGVGGGGGEHGAAVADRHRGVRIAAAAEAVGVGDAVAGRAAAVVRQRRGHRRRRGVEGDAEAGGAGVARACGIR